MITTSQFHEREKDQENKGSMYCLELYADADDDDTYVVDSAYMGNHARFINHSVPTLFIIENCKYYVLFSKILIVGTLRGSNGTISV